MLNKFKNSGNKAIYGMQWGNPEKVGWLIYVRNRFILPFINAEHTALEIGVGGGRWTKYLLEFKKIYAVDYHTEILNELKKNYNEKNMVFIKNNGDDFPGIPKSSIDFLFSFGTFVHLDKPIIRNYLKNIKPILKANSNVVIHYSDKTKKNAQMNKDFSDTTPEIMREMVRAAGYKIREEDTTLHHSAIVRFGI